MPGEQWPPGNRRWWMARLEMIIDSSSNVTANQSSLVGHNTASEPRSPMSSAAYRKQQTGNFGEARRGDILLRDVTWPMITAEVIYSPQRRPSVSSCTNGPQIGRDMCSTNQQLRRNDFWEDGGGLFLYTRSLGGAEKKTKCRDHKKPESAALRITKYRLFSIKFSSLLSDLRRPWTDIHGNYEVFV